MVFYNRLQSKLMVICISLPGKCCKITDCNILDNGEQKVFCAIAINKAVIARLKERCKFVLWSSIFAVLWWKNASQDDYLKVAFKYVFVI